MFQVTFHSIFGKVFVFCLWGCGGFGRVVWLVGGEKPDRGGVSFALFVVFVIPGYCPFMNVGD